MAKKNLKIEKTLGNYIQRLTNYPIADATSMASVAHTALIHELLETGYIRFPFGHIYVSIDTYHKRLRLKFKPSKGIISFFNEEEDTTDFGDYLLPEHYANISVLRERAEEVYLLLDKELDGKIQKDNS